EPGHTLQQVYERYQRAAETHASAMERNPSAGASLTLVGRQPEWRALQAAWERASSGDTYLALITGEAGIGKSRLAEELFTWASQQGFVAAHTRSYAAEGRLSLA